MSSYVEAGNKALKIRGILSRAFNSDQTKEEVVQQINNAGIEIEDVVKYLRSMKSLSGDMFELLSHMVSIVSETKLKSAGIDKVEPNSVEKKENGVHVNSNDCRGPCSVLDHFDSRIKQIARHFFADDGVLHSLLSYYVTIQFPHHNYLCQILNEIQIFHSADYGQRMNKAVRAFKDWYVCEPFVYTARLNAFVRYQMYDQNPHVAKQNFDESILTIIDKFDEVLPDWLASGAISSYIESRIHPLIFNATSAHTTEQHAAALFLARLHLQYKITDQRSEAWLRQLSDGDEAAESSENTPPGLSSAGSDEVCAKRARTSVDLLPLLTQIPSSFNDLIQFAIDRHADVHRLSDSFFRMIGSSSPLMLSILVCLHKMRQVVSQPWLDTVERLLDVLRAECERADSPEKMVLKRFARDTFQLCVDKSHCSNECTSIVRTVISYHHGYIPPCIGQWIHDYLFIHRGVSPLLGVLIGEIINNSGQLMDECSRLLLDLGMSFPLDVIEGILNEILPECLYEKPVELLGLKIVDHLSFLCWICTKTCLKSCNVDDRTYVLKMAMKAKRTALNLVAKQASSDAICLSCRCHFASSLVLSCYCAIRSFEDAARITALSDAEAVSLHSAIMTS